jgi:hypothetical protein
MFWPIKNRFIHCYRFLAFKYFFGFWTQLGTKVVKTYKTLHNTTFFHRMNSVLQKISPDQSKIFLICWPPISMFPIKLYYILKLNWRKNTFIFLSNNAVLWHMGDFRFTHYVIRSWNSSAFVKFNIHFPFLFI